MADINDFTNKNTKFTGTTGQRISTGATGTRVNEQGRIRFNTTTNLLEYYTGVEWKSIDAPPSITNFNIDAAGATTSTFIDRTLSGNASIVITGSLYSAGAVVSFRGNSGANFDATTTTVNSASSVTAVVPYSSFLAAQEPYSIRITNLSGLFAQLDGCLAVDAKPVFATASGTLGTIGDASRSSYSLSSAAATDPDGDTITYSITSGALPTGLSISSSTGAITGTASAVGSNTTSTFTVSAATTTQTATRSFSITVNAPVITSYTSVSPFSFSVPAGTTAVRALVIGGGGGGGRVIGGGGGAGGMVVAPSMPVTPGGTVSGNVGGGGGGGGGRGQNGGTGQSSSFGPITANGGGGGASWDTGSGLSGGSGGGSNGQGSGSGSTNQGSFPAVSATGYGFNGENRGSPGGGGGGAAAAGGAGGGGYGGTGRDDDISGSNTTYAGGGGGGGYGQYNAPGGPGGGGPAGGNGTPGTGNRGSGGGGGYHPPDYNGGDGGSGIVIVRY